ncbi:hypothetical protein VR44_19025, partial [Streptomyces katrae]
MSILIESTYVCWRHERPPVRHPLRRRLGALFRRSRGGPPPPDHHSGGRPAPRREAGDRVRVRQPWPARQPPRPGGARQHLRRRRGGGAG